MSYFKKHLANVKRAKDKCESLSFPMMVKVHLKEKKRCKSIRFPSNVPLQQATIAGDRQKSKKSINNCGERVASESVPSGLPLVVHCPHKKKQCKSIRFPSNILMQQAITDGDTQEMKKLINKYGRNVINEPEPTGLFPVMRCVFEGQLAPLRLLVEAGADLTVQDSENWTALHVAASMDDIDAARLICWKTCLTQVCNRDGERPIDLADSTGMARLLIDADLRAGTPEAKSESEAAILSLVQQHVAKNTNYKAINDALRNSTDHESLLHLAASKNYLELALYLFNHSMCELEWRDGSGLTALQTAIQHNSIDVMLFLVQSGASMH